MGAFGNFYTYLQDKTGGIGAQGAPVAYRYDASAFTSDPLGDIGQGEMVCWDNTNKRVLRFNRTAANGKLIGISRDAGDGLKKLGNQPGLNLTELSTMTSGVHQLVGTTGETYAHGQAVYMNGTDTTKVTKTAAGGTQVGTVFNPLNRSIVGAVRVPILIDGFTDTQI